MFHTRAQNNYTFTTAFPLSVLMPLIGAVVLQSDSFTASGKFVMTYIAKCGVSSINTGTWLDIDIELVNVATSTITKLPPANGSADAFCTSNGTSSYQWRMSSVTRIAGKSPESRQPVQERFQTVPCPWKGPALYVTEQCTG